VLVPAGSGAWFSVGDASAADFYLFVRLFAGARRHTASGPLVTHLLPRRQRLRRARCWHKDTRTATPSKRSVRAKSSHSGPALGQVLAATRGYGPLLSGSKPSSRAHLGCGSLPRPPLAPTRAHVDGCRRAVCGSARKHARRWPRLADGSRPGSGREVLVIDQTPLSVAATASTPANARHRLTAACSCEHSSRHVHVPTAVGIAAIRHV